jgi:tripartite-type tricarboxylate transporter receptor subunit TctC
MEARVNRTSLAGLFAIAVTALLALPTIVAAQSYPNRAVRLIISFAAGGSIDTLGRIVAQKLAETWGQSVFVENRPGAGGNIGAAAAAQSTPDGYTLFLGGQFLAANITIQPMKGFDPVRDFDPVIMVATGQDVLMVPPNSPFHSVKDLIDYAKAHPGELNYASLGTGSSGHLATVLFSEVTGIKLQHVPYSTFSQAVTDTMTGRISVWLATLGGSIGNIQGGKMRALAVSGHARASQLPDVPTFNELGVAYGDDTSWYALFAPHGTPKDIIAKINADTTQMLTTPDMQKRADQLGFRLVGGSPDQLGAHLKSEVAKWADVAKHADLVPK